MSELKHWLDDSSDADDFERAVLRAGVDADPPAARCDEVWASLLGALPLAPPAGAPDPSPLSKPAAATGKGAAAAGKTSTVLLGLSKGFVAGLALYGANVGTRELATRFTTPEPAPAKAQLVSSARQAVLPAAPAPAALPVESPAAPTRAALAPSTPGPAAPATASASAALAERPAAASGSPAIAAFADPPAPARPEGSARSSQLEAEARALREARAELRAGQLSAAFATLEASRRQFSAPALDQEREALTIELLAQSGQAAAAKARARAFLTRFPESPHAARVRQLAAP